MGENLLIKISMGKPPNEMGNCPFAPPPLDTPLVISNNGFTDNISFPLKTRHHYRARMDWLHTRLMILSSRYQYLYVELFFLRNVIMNTNQMIVIYFSYEEAVLREEEERQHHLQRMIEAERRHRLQQLIEEETEYQMHEYRNDLSRRFQGITSASPRIIAEYRVNGPLTASDKLMYENCPICIEDYQVKRHYARWSCPAEHMFHFSCILNVLRTGNKCPIYRHPVEALDLSGTNFFSWFMPRIVE